MNKKFATIIPHEPRKQTLISIVGTRDPFVNTLINDVEQIGPIMALLSAMSFDKVFLLAQQVVMDNALRTKEIVQNKFQPVKVEICDFNIDDPINYIEILQQLRESIRAIVDKCNNDEFYINVSSGTPQMHSSWILLAASGEIPGHIINIREKRHLDNKKQQIFELDFSSPDFPVVRRNLTFETNSNDNIVDINNLANQLGVIADHPSMQKVKELIAVLGPLNRSVVIIGETGTGKENTFST